MPVTAPDGRRLCLLQLPGHGRLLPVPCHHLPSPLSLLEEQHCWAVSPHADPPGERVQEGCFLLKMSDFTNALACLQ